MGEIDYRKIYNLEQYLFQDVVRQFADAGSIGARDLFCIVIWKANRAKSRIAQKLLQRGYKDLESAARSLTSEIHKANGSRDKLEILISGWNIPLPMASAILSVLYPNDFTVYDIRVCEEVDGFHDLMNKTNFESIWNGYVQYKSQVEARAPRAYSLRDKDRWLWGSSFYKQLDVDIQNRFGINDGEAT